jgi:hypothetical protein
MIPEERRWKRVKKDALPEDLNDLIDKLSRKKGKRVKTHLLKPKRTRKKPKMEQLTTLPLICDLGAHPL